MELILLAGICSAMKHPFRRTIVLKKTNSTFLNQKAKDKSYCK